MLYRLTRNIKYLIILLCAPFATSLTMSAQDGSVSYNFLNLPSSSHIYGLGGMNITTVEDNINTTDQNPALLGPEMDMQLGINYMRYIGETNFAGLKFAKKTSDRSAMAVGIQYFGYGEMKYADENGLDMTTAVIDTICNTVTFVVALAIGFLLILILLSAFGNMINLSFRLPNMDLFFML